MTTDIIELSKQAAEVLGIPPTIYDLNKTRNLVVWLAEDSGRCAEIAAERSISTDFSVPNFPSASFKGSEGGIGYTSYIVEDIADHNGDRKQAWRVAVLRAVIKQGKQSSLR